MPSCPFCGRELSDSADRCDYCKAEVQPLMTERKAKADLLMKIGAIIFIFGLFLPILFVTGGVIFGAGAVLWLVSRG